MINIKLKLMRLKALTKTISFTIFTVVFLLYGCISPRYMWEAGKDKFIGKQLDPSMVLAEGAYGAKYGSYFFSWNKKRKFDRVEREGVNTRYYITYGGPCKYSILLDENNVMLSWRYETKHRSRCTVH